jgi:hypothetical protein
VNLYNERTYYVLGRLTHSALNHSKVRPSVVYMPVIPASQEAEVRGSWSEAGPGQKCETLFEK